MARSIGILTRNGDEEERTGRVVVDEVIIQEHMSVIDSRVSPLPNRGCRSTRARVLRESTGSLTDVGCVVLLTLKGSHVQGSLTTDDTERDDQMRRLQAAQKCAQIDCSDSLCK